MIAWTLFQNPITVPASLSLWLILPLCFSIALVYKTIRIGEIRSLPRHIPILIAYMTGGLVILGGALWLLQICFA